MDASKNERQTGSYLDTEFTVELVSLSLIDGPGKAKVQGAVAGGPPAISYADQIDNQHADDQHPELFSRWAFPLSQDFALLYAPFARLQGQGRPQPAQRG